MFLFTESDYEEFEDGSKLRPFEREDTPHIDSAGELPRAAEVHPIRGNTDQTRHPFMS